MLWLLHRHTMLWQWPENSVMTGDTARVGQLWKRLAKKKVELPSRVWRNYTVCFLDARDVPVSPTSAQAMALIKRIYRSPP